MESKSEQINGISADGPSRGEHASFVESLRMPGSSAQIVSATSQSALHPQMGKDSNEALVVGIPVAAFLWLLEKEIVSSAFVSTGSLSFTFGLSK